MLDLHARIDTLTGRQGATWLLDVDGVINALGLTSALGRSGWSMAPWVTQEVAGTDLCYSIINRLHDEGHVQVHWLTTWDDHATSFLAPALGLGHYTLLQETRAWDRDRDHWWWKFNIASELAGDGRRVIWTDDELGEDETVNTWLRAHASEVLGVSSDEDTGLSVKGVHHVLDFLGAAR